MDLSKAYDCVNRELIVAKSAAYGLNEDFLRFSQNYFPKKNGEWKKRFFPERIARNYSRCPSRVSIRGYFI